MAYTFKHGDRPLDDFTIQRAVGRGGFGEVYYAVSDGGREVAIKYLKENPQVELRGVSHCINLKSPHLVSIFDVKKTVDGEYCIIMEYCSGPSLRDLLIAEPHGFAPEKAAFFAREIAKGLAYLHERGIVHRDLKPGNIFYDDGYVKIGDYGLSKFISVSRHSVQTSSVGTVHYMAPEIGSGNYSRGVDIYALGVILYEMLCGQVPFEGSTMAEVLMKHLTSQPELDKFPQPFGRVIRKALEKDPKDRYQTVEEMVEDLLSGEEIRQSVAGFSPNSLTVAVRQHAGDRAASPVPSPNPSPRARGGFALAAETMREAREAHRPQLPGKVAHKYERISRKIEKKLARLGGPPSRQEPFGAGPAGQPRSLGEYKKRIVLTLMLLVGLITAAAVVFGNMQGEDVGAAAGMLVAALPGAVVLASKTARWFGVQDGPKWALRMVHACCAAPLLAIACVPMLDGQKYHEEGLAVFLGLLAVSVFADWEKTAHAAWAGEMSFGNAVGKAIGAVVCTMIACLVTDTEPDWFVAMSAGVAAAASLIVQTFSWRPDNAARTPAPPDGQASEPPPYTGDSGRVGPPPPPAARFAEPLDSARLSLPAADTAAPAARWAISRAFWGLIAFALMGGTIVTFLIPLIATDWGYHDVTIAIVLCTAFASFMVFALRKLGPTKRVGFWRETLRPFLISVSLFGIGGNITGIAREWECPCNPCEAEDPEFHDEGEFEMQVGELVDVRTSVREAQRRVAAHVGPIGPLRIGLDGQEWRLHHGIGDEGRIALVAGLVLSSVAFLYLSLFTGRPPRPVETFLNEAGSAVDAPRVEPASSVAPHRGVLVLVLGLVSLVTMFFPLGIVAWVLSDHDVAKMRSGRMDPEGMGMTRAGGAFGMISVLVSVVFGLVVLVWVFTSVLPWR